MSGKRRILACDARCDKAWGINSRPKIEFDPKDRDDYAFLADSELGAAPVDPGWYEGFGVAKPTCAAERLNKWCARECERSAIVELGEAIKLPDLAARLYNKPQRRHDISQAPE